MTDGRTSTAQTMVSALNSALRDELREDERVMLLGEDIGRLGGVFRVTDGLQEEFGSDRIMDTPLGEAGIVGTAIGLALAGFRPVCEIQFDGFLYPAMNQIVSQLAKYRHRSGGLLSLPVVIRIPVGGGIGAIEHHSESPESYFVHTAGLHVLTPSAPHDAYHQLRHAIRTNDPVIFLEPKRLYWRRGEVDPAAAPDPWAARIVRPGDELTIATYGSGVPLACAAAESAAREGRSIEVIDLRSLSPLDDLTVSTSVQRTGRLVVVHEASRTLGLAAELIARVQERAFFDLRAPIGRVTGYDTPFPASRLEEDWLPNIDRVLLAVDDLLAFTGANGE